MKGRAFGRKLKILTLAAHVQRNSISIPMSPCVSVCGLEREVDSRTLGEFWCSDTPTEDSPSQGFIFCLSATLGVDALFCTGSNFNKKGDGFSFFASSMIQSLPTFSVFGTF